MVNKSPFDLFKDLPQTNCRACGAATCLAFAAAVINKNCLVSDCPHLERAVIEKYEGGIANGMTTEERQLERLDELKRQLADVDLQARAEQLGARISGEELIIKCLGRDFSVDQMGRIFSHCHTHAWFSIPFLNYILFGQGAAPAGEWISFRKLSDGFNWDLFFQRECPLKLKKLADDHGELFGNLISLFGATTVTNHLESDVSIVLHPFPKVPMMICYWRPQDDLDSDLRVFFDRCVDQNLGTESVFGLSVAIVRMLEKITEKHVK